MAIVPTPLESTNRSLRYRLVTGACDRWPRLADITAPT
jgi:hypothetical protein